MAAMQWESDYPIKGMHLVFEAETSYQEENTTMSSTIRFLPMCSLLVLSLSLSSEAGTYPQNPENPPRGVGEGARWDHYGSKWQIWR